MLIKENEKLKKELQDAEQADKLLVLPCSRVNQLLLSRIYFFHTPSGGKVPVPVPLPVLVFGQRPFLGDM